ncbi:MAG: Rpn family recombination-promoting nuclease/putative transposase, partial [Treponema sp.]|nr:Rpn family recombination-promoting nuclease/putative transposase [Treponema sp.]
MNRKYKDTLFVKLFSDECLLRDLYNALAGTAFGPDTPLSINSLSNVLFMQRSNDISFSIANHLVVLIEHQSTINYNMPLRFLLYFGRILEKLIDEKTIYRSAPAAIPLPDFYVVYNGVDPFPDYKELKLSDSFPAIHPRPLYLELIVKVLNINYGHNRDLLGRCEALGMYAAFTEMVRGELRPGMSRQEKREILQKVINRSIDEGILKEFLLANTPEVRNMLFTKWNWDDY